MTRLVLLGGGHAHLQVLRALHDAPLRDTQLTLVSPYPRLVYSGMVPGVLAGHYAPAACTIPIAPWAQRAGADFVQAACVGIDAAARSLRLDDGREIAYDLLSLDIGATMNRDAIPGAREHALFVRPIERFVALWHELLARARDTALDLVVVGGGAAGVELALALRHRLDESSRVSLVTGGATLLQSYPARVRQLGRRALQRLGVALYEQSCSRIEASGVQLADSRWLRCDLALLAIGAAASAWLSDSGLALDAQGFVATGPTLQSVSHPEVFAAGDVASRVDAPRPRSGVHAVRAGPPLAHNLRRRVDGAPLQGYRPQQRSLNLLACGDRRAIASWGPLAVEGGWAWRWKDRIDRAFVGTFAVPTP